MPRLSSVRFDEPRWWYHRPPTIGARLLLPFAALYGREAIRRFRRAEHLRFGLPIICVGNFTAGGTGKTPTAIFVAAMLERLGARPAFLSRGYRGREKGPLWVNPESHTAGDVGDEPLLLARTAPTVVSRDRSAGARFIETSGRCDILVMDDGLQNGSIAKDLTIAVVDHGRGLGNSLVIPSGPLRAPLPFQLELVDAIIINRPAGSNGASPFLDAALPLLAAKPVLAASTEALGETRWLTDGPIHAFCGIGAPDRFFDTLSHLGADIAARTTFPDHHMLNGNEAVRLLTQAREAGAKLVTTAKDWVRLGSGGALGELRSQARPLPIRLSLAPEDELRLRDTLRQLLAVSPRPGMAR
jgi:tetraacyldisaccharide 4'-kinase